MKKKNGLKFLICSLMFLLIFNGAGVYGDQGINSSLEKIDKGIKEKFDQLQIPGMSVIIVNGEDTYIKNYGYADRGNDEKVTQDTKFEIASLSKSFTGLGIANLVEKGLVNLEDPVSKYLPWFYLNHNGEKVEVTVGDVVHHTSGIPRTTIDKIPESSEDDALEKTVKTIVGMEIPRLPGEKFEYATINYDILGLIIEKVTGVSYEEYMEKDIFKPLGLDNTSVGKDRELENMAKGHKLGFLKAREYNAPEYRGNNPAGYIVTSPVDMARWLQSQMGVIETDLTPMVKMTQNEKSLELSNDESIETYGMGWFIEEAAEYTELSHPGDNPNYAAQVVLRPEENIGVAVLINSNSLNGRSVAWYTMEVLTGDEEANIRVRSNTMDKIFTIVSIILGVYLLICIIRLGFMIKGISNKKRRFKSLTSKKIVKFIIRVIIGLPFIIGIYLLPTVIQNTTWSVALVWGPTSFVVVISLIAIAIIFTYGLYLLSLIFPKTNNSIKEKVTI